MNTAPLEESLSCRDIAGIGSEGPRPIAPGDTQGASLRLPGQLPLENSAFCATLGFCVKDVSASNRVPEEYQDTLLMWSKGPISRVSTSFCLEGQCSHPLPKRFSLPH